jgi:UDP-glucose 6-dehydrogenase
VVEKIKKTLGSLAGKSWRFLGLAPKPDTDNMREQAALAILRELIYLVEQKSKSMSRGDKGAS